MKSFKTLVEGGTLDEAGMLSGKRHLQFKGKDEIGDFWVVMKGDKVSELADILFKADCFDLMLQKDGGLKIYNIVGIYKKESTATKIAKNELAGYGKD
jgi:hypothetical protein